MLHAAVDAVVEPSSFQLGLQLPSLALRYPDEWGELPPMALYRPTRLASWASDGRCPPRM